ncbi:zf-HC2 domain-containing protein [bacterium]|nr:zf-HC2 domain-containing protein [bacterium]
MRCEEIKPYLAGYLDGELDQKTRQMVEEHIKECPQCAAELEEMRKIREVLGKMETEKLPDIYWRTYWSNIYNRIERAIGWILLSIGVILLSAWGIFQILRQFFTDPTVSIVVKISVAALVLGVIVLLVSLIRERIFALRHERYTKIER